jgi:hypothetical protein
VTEPVEKGTTVRKTGAEQASSPLDLHAIAAGRFPLIPRAKPICRALDVRVARVRERAHQTNQRTEDSLLRAAEAHNLAALIMSDCGLPDLARALCWQQFEVFLTVRPLPLPTAKLALQPLINLARLLIRDGDGTGAYALLEALFQAVKSRADTVIDGRQINFTDLLSHDDDHRELVKWIWSILLTDGTRALTRTGRWAEALRHVEQHNGIGQRLLDGRQVAILARCATRDHEAACSMLADTTAPTSWEEAVAASLKVLCLQSADQPAQSATTAMVEGYLRLTTDDPVSFRVLLGLSVMDLAVGSCGVLQVAAVVLREALETADAYTARDVLNNETCRSHAAGNDVRGLTDTVRAAWLGHGTMPAHALNQLMDGVGMSEATIVNSLTSPDTSSVPPLRRRR